MTTNQGPQRHVITSDMYSDIGKKPDEPKKDEQAVARAQEPIYRTVWRWLDENVADARTLAPGATMLFLKAGCDWPDDHMYSQLKSFFQVNGEIPIMRERDWGSPVGPGEEDFSDERIERDVAHRLKHVEFHAKLEKRWNELAAEKGIDTTTGLFQGMGVATMRLEPDPNMLRQMRAKMTAGLAEIEAQLAEATDDSKKPNEAAVGADS